MFIIGKNKNATLTLTENGTEKILNNNMSFIQWVQEYSKKIVTITFFIFLIIEFATIVMILVEHIKMGDSMHLDVFISEANQTFREVIGGYIIKAAMENVSKGFSVIAEKYFDYKMEAIKFECKENQDDGPAMEDGEESDL